MVFFCFFMITSKYKNNLINGGKRAGANESVRESQRKKEEEEYYKSNVFKKVQLNQLSNP